MLVLAPAACILSGISLSEAFEVFTRSIKFSVSGLSPNAGDGVSASNVSMESQVMEADKKEDLLKEITSKRNNKKGKLVVEESSKKSGTEKRPLILPIDTSGFVLFLTVLLAAFYVRMEGRVIKGGST